jgi:segregation and condensation protein A
MTGTHQDYRVQLDAYAGPLDLLLYLVKRHEIDLNDIPVAELTEQYLNHLKVIQEIDVELAGEFLVMAATLLEVKSQMLVPQVTEDGEEAPATDSIEDPTDPRYELVQQLLAYKRFKDAAIDLEERQREWEARFPAHPTARPAEKKPTPDEAENAEQVEIDLEDANIMDLCEAFGRILDSIGHKPQVEVTYDDTPISLHAEDIADRLKRDGPMTLQKVFEGRKGRGEMVGLFLAVLELVRTRRVRVEQDRADSEIKLALRPEADYIDPASPGANPGAGAGSDAEATDWRDPETGEMQYDWPDEASRLRAERRAARRANRFGRDEADDPDDEDLADDAEASDAGDTDPESPLEDDEDMDDPV